MKSESQKLNHIFSLLVTESLNKKHIDLVNAIKDKRTDRLSFYDFIAIFVMSSSNGKAIEKFSDSITNIPRGFGHVLLNKFPTLEHKINVQPIRASDGTDLIAMISRNENDILIGLFENKFPTMVQKFILDHTEVVLVNKLGFILATSSTYGLEEKMDNSITLAIQNNTFKENELFHYSDHRQEMLSSITSLKDTNLYASVLTPHGIIYSSANKVSKNILMIGLAVILISAGVILAFTIKLEKTKRPTQKTDNTHDIKANFKKRYESLERVTLSELGNQRKDVFKEFSSFISREATGPLASAIGHLQIAKAKNSTPALDRHLEKSKEAIRAVQNVISKLAGFSGTDFREKVSLDINQILQDTIRLLELDLSRITLTTNYNKPKPVLANQTQLKQVFFDILSKIFDDMEVIGASELFLETINIDELVNINFKFLSNENFDPLPYNDKNLNLAACVGIIEEHGGNVTSNLDGSNVVISIKLPILNKDVYLKDQVLASVNTSNQLSGNL